LGNKKLRFSVVEKKTLRMLILFVVIQLVIIFISVSFFRDSQPTSIEDVKRVDIVVDDAYRLQILRENRLYVVSDSTTYVFTSRPGAKEYSVNQIYKSIHEGDRLFLMYKETSGIFGKVNFVVDARSETEIYRTFEGYNNGKKGLPLIIVIASAVIEIAFIGIVFVSVWLDRSTFKSICRKMKKHSLRN